MGCNTETSLTTRMTFGIACRRTPLNSIFMASQMLLRSQPSEHPGVLSIVESLGRRCSFLLGTRWILFPLPAPFAWWLLA